MPAPNAQLMSAIHDLQTSSYQQTDNIAQRLDYLEDQLHAIAQVPQPTLYKPPTTNANSPRPCFKLVNGQTCNDQRCPYSHDPQVIASHKARAPTRPSPIRPQAPQVTSQSYLSADPDTYEPLASTHQLDPESTQTQDFPIDASELFATFDTLTLEGQQAVLAHSYHLTHRLKSNFTIRSGHFSETGRQR